MNIEIKLDGKPARDGDWRDACWLILTAEDDEVTLTIRTSTEADREIVVDRADIVRALRILAED